MENKMRKFIDHIQSTVPDSPIEKSDLEEFCIFKSLKKGEVLLSMGSVCKHYYFVNRGVLRIYYFNDAAEERTGWIAFEGYFFTELESFTRGTPSQYEIVATEATEILQIHKNHIDLLIEKYDWFAKFLFHNQQETILNLTKVIELFQNHSVKNRYEELFKYPNFIQKVIFEKRFAVNFPKVESLIKNDLNRGHVSFTVFVASLYEAFLESGISDKNALLWTEESINSPIYSFVVKGTERMLDSAPNPFEALVASSKMREQSYFGDSFDFEHPIDDDFGYVLRIKKCLFHKTLKRLDRLELQPLLCRIDLGWINGIKPEKHGLRFVRPVTFASGSTCQMWFVKEEKLHYDEVFS